MESKFLFMKSKIKTETSRKEILLKDIGQTNLPVFPI